MFSSLEATTIYILIVIFLKTLVISKSQVNHHSTLVISKSHGNDLSTLVISKSQVSDLRPRSQVGDLKPLSQVSSRLVISGPVS